MNEELSAELARMVEEDQRLRRALAVEAGEEPSAEQLMELTRADVAHTDRLREIVDEFGWPGRSLVGEKGANDARLLAQHVDERRAEVGLEPLADYTSRWAE